MFRLPQMASGQLQRTKQWIQTNRSDTIGNLAWTFNMDPYYNLGKIRPTRMMCTDSVTSPTDTDMTDVPIGFKFAKTGVVLTVAGSFVHGNDGTTNGKFTKFTIGSGYPTNCSSAFSDIELFNNLPYVTTNSNSVYYYSGGAWTSFTAGSATTGVPHQLTTYGGRMYMVHNVNQIISWDTSNTVATMGNDYTLNNGETVFPSNQIITFIRGSANRIWIGVGVYGTLSAGAKGYIYEWDGTGQSTTRSYRLEASAPMACIIKDDIPYIIDSNGRLLKFNSGSFQEVARFPYFDKSTLNPFSSNLNDRFIHPNGMSIVNGRINILINSKLGDNAGSILEQCPSGVWEYDENVGLYHKYSLSYTATNGNTITDYGQNRVAAVGAIADMKINNTASNANGSFLVGAKIYTDGSNSVAQVWTNDTLPFSSTATYHSTLRAGYFVTTKLESSGLTEAWKGICIKYKNYIDAAEKIVVKYRLSEFPPTEMAITWINSTSFTTNDANMLNYSVGDEVEITQGSGGGMCSHITQIINVAGSFTVTVDEIHTGVTTGTAKARFQYWKKSGVALNAVKQFEQFNLPTTATSTWIQIKVFMIMDEGDEFEELAVINSVSQDFEG